MLGKIEDKQNNFLMTGLLAMGMLVIQPVDAPAETVISLSTGTAWTRDSDIKYSVPGGTDLTFRDIRWDTEPFEMPPYYGIRATHWIDRYPDWGFAFDFTHAKMISDRGRLVQVAGERNGVTVNAAELLGSTFRELEFSDGHNLFTLNAMRRWRLFQDGERMTFADTAVFVGGGIGVAMPHVEVVTGDTNTMGYQLAGPAAQFVAGVSLPLSHRFSLITEYRLTYADIDADLKGGGGLETDALTHHLNIGIGFGF